MRHEYYAVFRNEPNATEPLKIIEAYYGKQDAINEAEICGYCKPDYNVVRVSKQWIQEHKQFSVCHIV